MCFEAKTFACAGVHFYGIFSVDEIEQSRNKLTSVAIVQMTVIC